LHYTCTIPKPEGLYRVRLYDVSNMADLQYSMEYHSSYCFDSHGNSTAIEISGDLVFDDGFGDVQSAFENELFQGAVEHQNFKLSLDADPILATLVSAWRNLQYDVWLEVTLESRVQNIPALERFVMVQPRKTRLIWWGKLVRNEATGYVDYQSFKENEGLIRNPERKIHVGGLEMTFVHWLHVAFARKASEFLDAFRPSYTITHPTTTCFNLLYELVKFLSPTKFTGLSDYHLRDWQDWEKDALGFSKQFKLDYYLTNGLAKANGLDKIFIPVFGDPNLATFSALFLKASDTADKNAGENSLYTRWQTLGDAMVTFCREFFLKFDVELPTLREAWPVHTKQFGYTNLKDDVGNHWGSASRWVFASIDDFPIVIEATPLEKTIKYNPAAVWIKSIKIDTPTATGLKETNATSFVSYGEGKDISYKTLFRFIGQSWSSGHWVDDHRGFEFTFMDETVAPFMFYAKGVSFERNDTVTTFSTWNELHAFKNLDLWGGARAVIEFDAEDTGITPFPNSSRSYDFLDWGDFANLRYFDASPGLLYSGSTFGRFSVIEVSRKPGSYKKHIRGIERRVITPEYMPLIVLPPEEPPESPPVVKPPVVNPAEPLCGLITFVFGVKYKGCISRIEAKIDGIPYQNITGWDNSGTNFVACPLFVDTTKLINGIHLICVTIYPCDGSSPVTDCWTFNVSNPCTGNGQHSFMFDPSDPHL
jgi:hypothetical protein